MNPFVFHSPTKVTCGEGLASTAFEVAKELGGSKTFIVSDAVLAKTGILNPIIDAFDKDSYCLFTDVPSDSDVETVDKAAEVARQFGADSFLAIGGGSVIDTAKVVNICVSLGGPLLDYQGLNNLTAPLLPIVCIPTTAGTGSEVSMVAMVKNHKEGKKLLFGSRFLAPNAALLDPTLLVSLPARLTAATGLDAITHAIESFSAVISSSPFTDALCLEALRMLFEFLPRATADGADIEARSGTLVASAMAGVAFTNSGVGIVHALAHATGATFGTHHGLANSILLPHCMTFNVDTVANRYALISRYLNFSSSANDNDAASALIKAVSDISARVGLPARLRDTGIPALNETQLEELAFLAATDPAIMFNPKESSAQDIIEIYERAY
ncbi:MAG: iron-containing alcohol dehydrogenase [Candidatus Obscuribacterales bacterium]|nr:MAG: iron-containing alcohol dehydrogenase [Candidatus Melainabacteria bacterium]